jgi:hypothetical protein
MPAIPVDKPPYKSENVRLHAILHFSLKQRLDVLQARLGR